MQILAYIIGFIILSASGCGKNLPDADASVRQVVKLQAQISHPYGTVPLGDTITLQLNVPDTLITETGDTIPIQTLNKAGCSFFVNVLDSAIRNDTIQYSTDVITYTKEVWVSSGFLSDYSSIGITPGIRPYQLKLHFKPVKKGIYSFDVRYPPMILRANNNSFAAQLYVGFNVPYNNIEWTTPYFGKPYVVAAKQHVAEGFGLYYFKVE